jgi:uncharacterized membrane protein
MDQFMNTLGGLDQDQAIVALFTAVLVACGLVACLSLVLRSPGKWGRVAMFVAGAAVVIAWRVA